ncbi:Ferric uptake regulator, Fur family [uncultured Desulfobacterium sp.]|uniref:Ferric uptake regulator, Fur family n=1 Tax=uncultured Desulfobacterium sp. TaxID=201089 RepID=A0A445MU15_9BACT|nr:Ferric uptake regulator, Fur family [uncultured Desulfobacterium sp.]
MNRIESFRKICKEQGIKVTPQRTAIFDALEDSRDHPTAEIIFQAIRKRFPTISLDTVYRTLMTFVKIGIAHVVETQGNTKRFDANMEIHHHAHCLKCGKILDFYSADYDNLEVPQEIRNQFTVMDKKVVIHGVCKKCSQKQKDL